MIRAVRNFVLIALVTASAFCFAQNELRFVLRSEPKTFNPVLVDDDASETVRYLTGGVLIRVNRRTQMLQPELAASWKVLEGGRKISFKLRDGVKFSDGTPFSTDDVAYTVKQLMDPNLHSTTGDSFRSAPGDVTTQVTGKDQISITFPAPVAGLERLFDQVAIMSAHSPAKEMAVLGPFLVADHKPGSLLLLKRNPNYWKKDEKGRALPYIDAVRLDVQQNRDMEVLRFRRGEIQLINTLDSEFFDRLSPELGGVLRDIGPSLDGEQMWFNQVPTAPIPDYKRAWFRSTNFRRAVSAAINRNDICRLVFGGHAVPGVGPVSPANKFWFNSSLKPTTYDQKDALNRLQQDGFKLQSGVLRDRSGHPVEFSIITNAGNKPRERMATMIQQDLGQIGMKVTIVTLDFPSLIDRITQGFNYEAAILGLINNTLDPNSQMNVWLSSSDNHQWNPKQKAPATDWEAELDKLMRAQSSTADEKKRKQLFDRVQEIVHEQAPFIYLVHKNALAAVSKNVQGADPVILRPQTYWNIERLSVTGGGN